mmetsp:Transcript_2386/g.4797  ORF Transcript_2386/g.4797 Transcript_2386/m.4797 type:complete len:118 (+) Transcript_2386:721-1074(+)
MLLQRHKIREEAITAQQAREQEEWFEAGAINHLQKAVILKDQETWTLTDIDARLALFPCSKTKQEAMLQQWKHLKGWAEKGRLEFPFSKQQAGSLVVWKAGMDALLKHEKTKAIADG